MAGAVLLVGTAPASARAQDPSGARVSATLDAGWARVDYDDFLPSSLVSVAGLVRLDGPAARLVVRGFAGRYESTGNLNVQGAASAGAFTPAWRGMRAELGGELAAGRHQTVGSSGAAQLRLRLHAPIRAPDTEGGTAAGIWLGGAAGWTSFDGTIGDPAWQGDAGAWARWGRLGGTVAFRPTLVGQLRYADAVGSLRWTGRRLELGAEAGVRAGDVIAGATEPGARAWASADAVWQATGRFALVGAVGRSPIDPVAGVGGGSYGALSLRVALRGDAPAEPPRVLLPRVNVTGAPSAGSAPVGGGTSAPDGGADVGAALLTVTELGGERVRLELVLPGAGRVELAGDFTDWEPVALRREGGRWTLELALEPGVHRLNVRVDGGEWGVPPSLTAVDDGFGGRVGLLVVR